LRCMASPARLGPDPGVTLVSSSDLIVQGYPAPPRMLAHRPGEAQVGDWIGTGRDFLAVVPPVVLGPAGR
jgi:hypothetical protein